MTKLKQETLSVIRKIIDIHHPRKTDHTWHFEHFDSWHFARVCIGWAQFERPSTAISYYLKLLNSLEQVENGDNIVCFFNNGNIEFREKEDICKHTEHDVKISKRYVDFYSKHHEYVDQILKELKEQTEFETFGHLINPVYSCYKTFLKLDKAEYLGHCLNDAFVYKNHMNKDLAIPCIENVKNIFSKHGDFDFIVSEKKSDLNGYWCLFIKNKKTELIEE